MVRDHVGYRVLQNPPQDVPASPAGSPLVGVLPVRAHRPHLPSITDRGRLRASLYAGPGPAPSRGAAIMGHRGRQPLSLGHGGIPAEG